MDFSYLRIPEAFVALYIACFLWQYLSHNIRLLMLKYYIREGHEFIHAHYANDSGFFNYRRWQAAGVRELPAIYFNKKRYQYYLSRKNAPPQYPNHMTGWMGWWV